MVVYHCIMATMDALTGTFTLSCPRHGTTTVRLSAFHRIERLAGAAHPAVYRVEFDCGCGGEHPALVSHDVLDWAPLGLESSGSFLNLIWKDAIFKGDGQRGDSFFRNLDKTFQTPQDNTVTLKLIYWLDVGKSI